MRKIAIFCESYGTISTTLHLATQYVQENTPVTIIIPFFPDLFQFITEINERVFNDSLNVIYLQPKPERRQTSGILKKIVRLSIGLLDERAHLKRLFHHQLGEIIGYEIFFSSRYNGALIYFLKRLSRNNSIVYIDSFPPGREISKPFIPFKFHDLLLMISARFVYGPDPVMIKFPFTDGYIYMPDRFIEKHAKRVIGFEEREEMVSSLDMKRFQVFDTGSYAVIYFSHRLGSDTIPDQEVLKEEIGEIFKVVNKYFPKEEIATKHHPGHVNDEDVMKIGHQLEAYIPAEFFLGKQTKMYLSFWSLSIAHVEEGLAVSLMDLITLVSEEIREQYRVYLLSHSKSEILFPKTLHEFEKIIKRIKKE